MEGRRDGGWLSDIPAAFVSTGPPTHLSPEVPPRELLVWPLDGEPVDLGRRRGELAQHARQVNQIRLTGDIAG